MRMKTVGNKRDILATVIHNAEATATIQVGMPVCLKLVGDATGPDGLDVFLPSSAHTQNAGNEFTNLYGICVTPGGIAPGQYGEAQVFGFCPDIAFTSATRSASSGGGSWSTVNSQSCWTPLLPETVGNGWTTYSPSQYLTTSTGTAGVAPTFPGYQVLLTPFSVSSGSTGIYSIAASATNVSDTRTALFSLVKGYVRIL